MSSAVKTIFREVGSPRIHRSSKRRRTAVRRTVTPRSGFDSLFMKLAAAALRLEKSRPRRR